MRHVISISQRKGGVGKTTVAVCLSAELRARGYDTALIDGDPQRSASQWAEPGKLGFPVHAIALDDRPVGAWAQAVQDVEAACVVIDTAPSDRALGAAIALADLVIIPCTPSGLDLEATARTLEIVNAVRVRRNGIPHLILAPNRVDARTLEGQQLADELKAFNEHVSPPIGDRTAFVRAFSDGQAMSGASSGRAAYEEIRSFCDFVESIFAAGQPGPRMGSGVAAVASVKATTGKI